MLVLLAACASPPDTAVIDTEWGQGLTFSCATCHTGTLFGRTVVGMRNRRARANGNYGSRMRARSS